MKELILDGAQGMDAIHSLLSEKLRLPHWYGYNLDAMYDCLSDVSEDVRITLTNRDALGLRGLALERLLQEAAAANPHIHL